MPPYMNDNRVLEEEERVSLELVAVNQSLSDISLDDIVSSVSVPSREDLGKDFGWLEPPVTRLHLIMMEEQVSPPSIDVCHNMIFDTKVKLLMQNFSIHDPDSLKRSEQYWDALQREIALLNDRAVPYDSSTAILPKLLDEMKSMLTYLYPESKLMKENLLDNLDAAFVMEQIKIGNTDAMSLAVLLGTILKANCAPKRDGMIEHMMMLGGEGNWIGMLKLCLELMELMKLNRKHILKGIVEREKQHFASLFNSKILSLESTRKWLSITTTEEPDTNIPLQGFVNLVLCWTGIGIPETFALDAQRLLEIRDSFQDIAIITCAMMVLKHWTKRSLNQITLNEIKTRLKRCLSSQQTKIDDIGNQILLVASRRRGTAISGPDRELLLKSVDRILHPDNALYLMLKHRLGSILKSSLEGKSISDSVYKKAGLETVQSDIEALISSSKHLWTVNYKIHGELYRQLLTEL